MLAKAEAKYLRMSPSKARLVTDLVKGKTVEEANFILDNVNKRASTGIKKVVNSAFSNLNFDKQDKMLSKDVCITHIRVDGGPILHRFRAATMGRATPIRHRTAHIYVELDKVVTKKKKTETKKTKTKKTESGSK